MLPNSVKSFTMVFSKFDVIYTCKITAHGNILDQVDKFVYLGSLFDDRYEQDVRRRITIAKSAFPSLETVLKNGKFNFQLRYRLLKCYVWSILLYKAKAWILSADMLKKLEAAEMWFLRKMLRMSHREHVTNEEASE